MRLDMLNELSGVEIFLKDISIISVDRVIVQVNPPAVGAIISNDSAVNENVDDPTRPGRAPSESAGFPSLLDPCGGVLMFRESKPS